MYNFKIIQLKSGYFIVQNLKTLEYTKMFKITDFTDIIFIYARYILDDSIIKEELYFNELSELRGLYPEAFI